MKWGRVNRHFMLCMILIILAQSIINSNYQVGGQEESSTKIMVIFTINENNITDDLGYITSIDEAIDDLSGRYGNQLEIEKVYPLTYFEANTTIVSAAQNGTYDLIVAMGYGYIEKINSAEIKYPDQKFLLVDGASSNLNGLTRSILFKEHEGSFLAGAIAAMVSQTKMIGFIGATDNDLINRFKFGFYQGIHFIADQINEEFEVSSKYIESEFAYADPDKAYSLTQDYISEEIDIIYVAAGGSNLGVFDAVANYNNSRSSSSNSNQVYAIGVDRDQDYLKPGLILTSMMKRIDVVLINEITALIDGNWESGTYYFGIEDEYIGLSDMKYTPNEKNFVEERFNGKSRAELVQFLESAIINGEIVVSEAEENAEINIDGENPFEKESGFSNFEEFIRNNQVLLSSSILGIAVIVSVYILRDRIIQVFRKSDKEKAIEYIDKAKKLSTEEKK